MLRSLSEVHKISNVLGTVCGVYAILKYRYTSVLTTGWSLYRVLVQRSTSTSTWLRCCEIGYQTAEVKEIKMCAGAKLHRTFTGRMCRPQQQMVRTA